MVIKDLHNPNLIQDQMQESAALFYQSGQELFGEIKKEIVSEHRIAVFVNDRLTAQLVCTPSDFVELVIGRLLTEGILESTEEVREIYICEKASRARVFLVDSEKKLTPFVEQAPTCCSDNHIYMQAEQAADIRPVSKVSREPKQILAVTAEIQNGSQIYRKTHGTHGGILIYKDQVVYQCEDIGRHNAIDKAIGYLAIHNMNPSDCMIYSTGRASADMVRKVIRAQISVFLSKAAPTGAAIDMAKAYGLTLISNLKTDSFELFSS